MTRYLLALFFIPSLVFAQDVGESIDSLLEQFFGSGQTPIDYQIDIDPESVETLENERFGDISEEELREDIERLQQAIWEEESKLEAHRSGVKSVQMSLRSANTETARLQRQLELVDAQIGLNKKRIESYIGQTKRWKKSLEDLSRERESLKTKLRVYQREYASIASQEYLRLENRQDPYFQTVYWLLSKRTVSEILEDNQRQRNDLIRKKTLLNQIKSLKTKLESEERQTAILYSQLTKLLTKEQRERSGLKQMAEAQLVMLERLKQDSQSRSTSLSQARQRQSDSTSYLRNLRRSLGETNANLKLAQNLSAGTPAVLVPQDPEAEVDEMGLAVIKPSLFVWPVQQEKREVSAHFHDEAYAEQFGREHDGIDLPAPQGTNLLAAANGRVEKVSDNGFGYSYIILKHENGFYTVYGHLSKMLVEVGSTVYQGQIIAQSGGTPGTRGAGYFTTGPHLHFEVFKGGEFLDPRLFLPAHD